MNILKKGIKTCYRYPISFDDNDVYVCRTLTDFTGTCKKCKCKFIFSESDVYQQVITPDEISYPATKILWLLGKVECPYCKEELKVRKVYETREKKDSDKIWLGGD